MDFMLQYEELKQSLEGMKPELDDLADALNLSAMRKEIQELDQKATAPDFWDNMEKSQKILQRSSSLKDKMEKYEKLKSNYEDLMALIELADEEDDVSLLPQARQELDVFRKGLEDQRLMTLLTGEYDAKNAILTFHAGAGGTEAQDWTMMLYRMYCRWGERHGFKVKTLDSLEGEEAGLKSASILLEGENAYGFMKSEAGVHRLVRISPFDASGRRHTSFASLEVMPEIDDTIKVDIRPEDIKMDVFRSSGAGGQKVNKTSSAVRLTHIPTGIVVSCQVERSQYQNRDVAMKMLKSKLMEIKEREHLEKIEDIKGVQKEIAWGSQIRSYVFMPYTLVKDHRTGYEDTNIESVMDGNLDGFINAYLKFQTQPKDAVKKSGE
jgi:peptide chain release factor 2